MDDPIVEMAVELLRAFPEAWLPDPEDEEAWEAWVQKAEREAQLLGIDLDTKFLISVQGDFLLITREKGEDLGAWTGELPSSVQADFSLVTREE